MRLLHKNFSRTNHAQHYCFTSTTTANKLVFGYQEAAEENGVSSGSKSLSGDIEVKKPYPEDDIFTLEAGEATLPENEVPQSAEVEPSQNVDEMSQLARDMDSLDMRNEVSIVETLIADEADGEIDGEIAFDDFVEEDPSQIHDAPKNQPQLRKLKLSNPNLAQKFNRFGAVSGQQFNKLGNASVKLGAAGGQRLNKLGARMRSVSQRQGTDSGSRVNTAADSAATGSISTTESSGSSTVQQLTGSEAQKQKFGSKFAEAAKKAKDNVAKLNRPRSSSDANDAMNYIPDQQVAPTKRNENTGAGAKIGDTFSRMAKSANQRIKKIGPGNVKEITPPTFAVRAKNVQTRPLAHESPPKPPELVPRIGKYIIGVRIKEMNKTSTADSIEEPIHEQVVASITLSQEASMRNGNVENDAFNAVDQRKGMQDNHDQRLEVIDPKADFEIVTRRTDGSESQGEITVDRTLTQVLSLHATLCSAVEKISSYRLWMLMHKREDLDEKLYNEYVNDLKDHNLGSAWGTSPLNQVRLCGKLLDGLLKFSQTEIDAAYLIYIGK